MMTGEKTQKTGSFTQKPKGPQELHNEKRWTNDWNNHFLGVEKMSDAL